MNESAFFKSLSNFSCFACKSQFFIKDFTLKGSKCPVLLHCGHSICNHCFYQKLRGTNSITCQLCGFVSTWESAEFNKFFSFNFYMLGSLLVQNSKSEREKKLAFLTKNNCEFKYSYLNQSKNQYQPGSNDIFCEECSIKAIWHCENCKSNFCEICWTKVHGSAKSLTKHFRSSVHDVNKMDYKKCPEHDTQNLEFYCKDCSKTVCSHCVILQHQGEEHSSITLKKKNLEIFNEVKVAVENAEKINKRMKETLEELKIKQTTLRNPNAVTSYVDLEKQIMTNFNRIHGILQLEEERLLKKIREKSKERETCFKTLQNQLETQTESIDSLLRECELALKQLQTCDLTDFYRQLIEIKEMPCYLVQDNSDMKEPKVEFDDKIIDSLRNFCKIDIPEEEIFELRSIKNLPEGYAVEPLSLSGSEQSLKESQESNTLDYETASNSSSRELQPSDSSSMPLSKEPKVFYENRTYSVRVSFIKNPGEFYVTLNSQRAKQKAIDKQASNVARFSFEIPKTYEKGDIYLVKYHVDKKWYRGRVVEVIPPKRTGGENSVLVYYLDYGNFETVSVSRLRPIPSDLLEEYPLAVKCKLFDCVPQGEEWSGEATKTMEKILKFYTATMYVMKVQADYLEVDLSVFHPDGQIGKDIVSVRDALLFLGYSSFVHGVKVPRIGNASKYLEQYYPHVGDTFDVTVTHVNSPSDFYVQKSQDASYILKLTKEIESYYEENLDKGMIYSPTIDMPCVALFSIDQKWYRAKIVDIPAKKMVTVFYVDYGNKETVQWTDIKKLKENFARCPPFAYGCALTGIFPLDGGGSWHINAKNFMKRKLMMKDGYLTVQGKTKSGQKLKVLLYKKGGNRDFCVNTGLVDAGLASQAYDPERLELLNRDNFPLNADEQKLDYALERGYKSEERDMRRNRFYKDPKKNKMSAKELRELHEYEKQRKSQEKVSTGNVDNETEDYKNIFRVKVNVLLAESPSSIYVTFPSLMTEYENLQKDLKEMYEKSTSPNVEWSVGSGCAVFDSKKGIWFRASILSMLPDDQVKLLLRDTAEVITESVSSLRELDPVFKKYSSCALKCHLADVVPPGDKWPSISAEYLNEEIEIHKEVYMTRRGQAEDGSLPIELWIQKIISRGALEPLEKEWVTLNRLLVSQGLAIPVKTEKGSNLEMSTEDDECSEENKSADKQNTKPSTDEKDDEVAFVPSPTSNWLPPVAVDKTRFVGIPTYVDLNALIYMYDVEKDEKNLKKIREVLHKEYNDSKPNPEDHFWVPGQLCIVKYHIDNYWYRGRIIKEQPNGTYEVLFVDYGNVENCVVADLRKKIKMHDIPILTHKFQLDGVDLKPDWPESAIDFLHSLVVDKRCKVNVLKQPENPEDPYIINLRVIENNVEAAAFFIENIPTFKPNVKLNNHFLMSLEIPDCSKGSLYIPLTLPDDLKEFFIDVTKVYSHNIFFANIVMDESLPPDLIKILNEFNKLQEELNKKGYLQPDIDELTEDLPCCGLDFTTDKWCRGEVESFTHKKHSVCVFFVDFGTKELLHKDFVRQAQDNWKVFPKMAIKFKLDGGTRKCVDVSESVYTEALNDCLVNKPKIFAQIIKKWDDYIEVKLYKDKNGPLAYQKMIDEGLMEFV